MSEHNNENIESNTIPLPHGKDCDLSTRVWIAKVEEKIPGNLIEAAEQWTKERKSKTMNIDDLKNAIRAKIAVSQGKEKKSLELLSNTLDSKYSGPLKIPSWVKNQSSS